MKELFDNLGDKLWVFLLIGAIIYKTVKAAKDMKKDAPGTNNEGENSPLEMEKRKVAKEETTMVTHQQRPRTVNQSISHSSISLSRKSQGIALNEKTTSAPLSPEEQSQYRIDSTEEARRAFIYSEIFTRKY